MQKTFERAEVVFITMPTFCMDELAGEIEPYVRKGMKIGFISGTGGGESVFKECEAKGAIIFGMQRVPSVARLIEYGKTEKAIGYRDRLFVASLPDSQVFSCAELIYGLFDIPCNALPNYLNLTLTPSNPILHTTRLRVLFKHYKEGVVYDEVPLFYEDWNDETSELLLACDKEVQNLCRNLKQFDLSGVKSLMVHYESYSVEEVTRKIAGIPGFRRLISPMIKVKDGYIPDINARYFTADFPYGLAILVQIAALAGVDVPNMNATLMWYYGIVGKRKEFKFSDYGINNFQQLVKFYAK